MSIKIVRFDVCFIAQQIILKFKKFVLTILDASSIDTQIVWKFSFKISIYTIIHLQKNLPYLN